MLDKGYDIFSFISQNFIYTTHPINFFQFFGKSFTPEISVCYQAKVSNPKDQISIHKPIGAPLAQKFSTLHGIQTFSAHPTSVTRSISLQISHLI